MVNVVKRMTRLAKLVSLRLGDGAVIFPPEVKKLQLNFARGVLDGGHKGPRLFWRSELRRMKYYNPALAVTVTRSTKVEDPATMIVFFAKPSAETLDSSTTKAPTSSAPAPGKLSEAPIERTEVIDMKNRTPFEICEELVELTNARKLEPDPALLEQRKELKEKKEASRKDADLMSTVRQRVAREKEKDTLARGNVNIARP